MSLVKNFLSHLLILRASRYQGRGQFDKVIEISKKALTLNPNSKSALLFLGEDCLRTKDYEQAKKFLDDALSLYPDDCMFNRMYVDVLVQKGESASEAVPYIQTYFKNRPRVEAKFPFFAKLIIKTFRRDFDYDEYAKKLDSNVSEWEKSALDILAQAEKSNTAT